MKKYLWIGFPIVALLIIIKSVFIIDHSREVFIEDFHTKWIAYQKMYKPKCIEIKKEEPIEEVEEETPYEEPIEQEVEQQVTQPQEVYQEPISDSYTTRMTSYYPEEGETMTATGLGINNFQINENGWFTYQGKLVVATASTRLGYTNMRTYNLYDELILNIDGINYQAIVLDVCGACQRDNRIDLFVSSYIYAKDINIIVQVK